MNTPKLPISAATRLGGTGFASVINPDGSVAYRGKPVKNLVLYPGIEFFVNYSTGEEFYLAGIFQRALAGDGATPNSTETASTYSQTGNTVTRETGAYEFDVGHVGKSLKFGSGEEAYITAFVSATEVTVRESQEVAATSVVVWHTDRTALDNQLASALEAGNSVSRNYAPGVHDYAAGTTFYPMEFDFPEVSGAAVTYREIGLTPTASAPRPLTARIVLDAPVVVQPGQQLRFTYNLTLQADPTYITETAIDLSAMPGWPRPYTVTSITHDGAGFDISLTEDHHYEVGYAITISDTASAFDGTWTIDSIPTSNTIRIVDATIPNGTSVVTGAVRGSLAATALLGGSIIWGDSSAYNKVGIFEQCGSLRCIMSLIGGETMSLTPLGEGQIVSTSGSIYGTASPEQYIRDTANHAYGSIYKVDVSSGVANNIIGIILGGNGFANGHAALQIKFAQKQRKDSGYNLTLGYQILLRPTLAL